MSYRVKYYSPGDLGRPSIMNKVDEIYKNFDSNKTDYSINEILEFYNTNKYLDDGSRFLYWVESDIKKWSGKLKSIYSKFINSIGDESFENTYKELEYEYIEDFWYLLCKNKVFRNIGMTTFENFIRNVEPQLYLLLEHKNIVNHFDSVIKAYFLSEVKNAELLLDKYEVQRELQRKEIFIPTSLSLQEKEKVISDYVDNPEANTNYLRLIETLKSNDKLKISNKIKLRAKQRLNKESEEHFENNEGLSHRYIIEFSDLLDGNRKLNFSEHETQLIYSSKWIEENSDYKTLINNFIYLFEYVDHNYRTTLTSNKSDIRAFEEIIGLKSKTDYIKSWAYDYKDSLSNLQIHGYFEQLKKLNIRLEDIFEWFFNTYCLEEFSIKDYHIKMPSESSSFFEKCRTILPEMERSLKLFNQLVEDNEIDLELLEISSDSIAFEFSKSFLDKKYFYASSSEDLRILNYLLFSDKCRLNYLERLEVQHDTFYELIMQEDTTMNDYPEYKQRELNWLIERNYIKFNNQGVLEICNPNQIYILKELYENEVLHYLRYSKVLQTEINSLFDQGFLTNEKTLFSKPEQDYLSYHMDNRKFSNTLGLRNLYLHGSQPRGDNEQIHYNNYMVFLKLFSIYIIKINDELCLREELRGTDEENI